MLSTEMVKAFQFVGAIVLFGGAFFSLWVWAPVLGRPHPALRWGVYVGAGFLLLFGGADLLRLARVAADQPLAEAGLRFVGEVAVQTRYGRMILLRALLALVATAVRSERSTLAAGIGGLISFAYAGHSGVEPVAFAVDLAHLVAVGAWAGGLAALAAMPWREMESQAVRRITLRFSAVGVGAVLTLAATGVYLAAQRVYGPQALVETDYGKALLAKVLLFSGLVTLAAVNRYSSIPRLESRRSLLQSLIWAEAVAMLFALGFAADLTTLSPADQAPVRVAIVMTAAPETLDLPLGRRVRLTLVNDSPQLQGLVVRGMEHRLFRGPGALRHREMLTFAPPADRLWVQAAPGKSAVVEFTPLAEGDFTLDAGGVARLLRVRSASTAK